MAKPKRPDELYCAGIAPADWCLRLYNARQAARVLGVHENTVYMWLKDGTLKSTQRTPGGSHLIPRSEIERLGLVK